MNKIIILSGPTASGKTSLSIELAQKNNLEIINFDSLLFYQELNIGTAKPTIEERQDIIHHCIDICSISTPIDASGFVNNALPLIESLHQQKKIPLLVGGSGFYLQALINGMFPSVTTPAEIIQKSNDLYFKEGIAPFWKELKEKDLESFQRLHENDHYRIRRAVEHFWTTEEKFSSAKKQLEEENLPLYKKKKWDLLHIYLDIPKEEHLGFIYQRTKQMLKNGLIDEVKQLLTDGFTGEEKPLASIGYKQVLSFLNGQYSAEDELEERINIATRRLAKSQRTWFKTKEKKSYHPIDEKEQIYSLVKRFITQPNGS